ncbi:MAG: demethylmenaquinone methyltransferase/2-methoxy-6-polyprenyl-1,4-benzoquinol methylase [Verrucomicrobiales bacterium]|jgi:demethylmenaquinone methyltransferase/2-methoxy-6-polyprenyl-1,4-benzoquinol methylase
MSQDPAFVRAAFSSIAPRYVLTNHVLSLGIDVLWRRRVAKIVESFQPEKVLDLATGSGDLALAIEKRCPEAEIIAADFCPEMLEVARKAGVKNTIEADAMNLPFGDAEFDVVTVAYGLRNMESWLGAAQEMRRVLKPGGNLVILDFSLPKAAILRGPYRFYLHRILPKVAGLLAKNRQAYEYLSDSIERFPSGPAMQQLLGEAGFEETQWIPLSGGISAIYVAKNPA